MDYNLKSAIQLNEEKGFHYFKQRNLDVFETVIVSDIFNHKYFIVKEPLYEVMGENAIEKVSDEKYFFIYEIDWLNGFVCKATSENFTHLADAKAAVYLLPQIDNDRNVQSRPSTSLDAEQMVDNVNELLC